MIISPISPSDLQSPRDMAISPTPPSPSPSYQVQFYLHEAAMFADYQKLMAQRFPQDSQATLAACSTDLAQGYQVFAFQNGLNTKVKRKVIGNDFYSSELGKTVLHHVNELEETFQKNQTLKELFEKGLADHINKDTSFGQACAVLIAKQNYTNDMEAIEHVDENQIFFFQAMHYLANMYNVTLKNELGKIRETRKEQSTAHLQDKRKACLLELEPLLAKKTALKLELQKLKREQTDESLLCVKFLVNEDELQKKIAEIKPLQVELRELDWQITEQDHLISSTMNDEFCKLHISYMRLRDEYTRQIEQLLLQSKFFVSSNKGSFCRINEKGVWLFFKKSDIHNIVERVNQNALVVCSVYRKASTYTFSIFAKGAPYQIYDSTLGLISFGDNRDNLMNYVKSRLEDMADSKEDPITGVTCEFFL
jgi:hypothetical protein